MRKKTRVNLRASVKFEQTSEVKHMGGASGDKSNSEPSIEAVGQDASQKHSYLGGSVGDAISKSVSAEAVSDRATLETHPSARGAGVSLESSDGPSVNKVKVKHEIKVK